MVGEGMSIYSKLYITLVILIIVGFGLNVSGSAMINFPNARDRVQFSGIVAIIMGAVGMVTTFLIMIWSQ